MKNLCQRPFFYLFLLFSPQFAFTQGLHSPAELLEILERSKLTYQVAEISNPDTELPRGTVNNPFSYQKIVDGQPRVGTYEFEGGVKAIFNEAEKAFTGGDDARATEYYRKAADMAPDYAVIHTFLGQSLARQGFIEEAIKSYRTAISLNYHDYMAHWFLADMLAEQKKKKEAAREISIAWVLNRNNPRIQSSLKRIYKMAGNKYQDFTFRPDYTVNMKGEKVSIEFREEWMMYAFCKAIWRHEPGYRKSMGGPEGAFNIIEEKESLLNLMLNHQQIHGKKKSKVTEINFLKKSMENEYTYAFILCEIWLVQEPLIIYLQSKEAILDLANYVMDIRGEKL